jgi:hypothetical protein
VHQQSFSTKWNTWERADEENTWLKNLNDSLFSGRENLMISCNDIFETIEIKERIVKKNSRIYVRFVVNLTLS